MTDSFPRQQARTQGFSLGVPRSFQISPDGARVAFLRSQGGTDPVTCLWLLDVASGTEQLIADPAGLGGAAGLTDQEKALRERTRERAAGITAYATDTALSLAAFSLAGQVWVTELAPGATARPLPARVPAFDPRPDPSGQRVAYVCEGALRVTDLRTGEDKQVIGPDGAPGVTYGLAEFIAAEEMGRVRGYWWAPDGTALLVARADDTPVQRWYIADPANPGRAPAAVAYPAAGTPNAEVSLLRVGLDGGVTGLETGGGDFPYLVTVEWDDGGALIVVQSRDQKRMRLLVTGPDGTGPRVLREDTDPHWLDIVPGVPARAGGGAIVWTCDADDTRRLLAAAPQDLASGRAEPVTPPGLQVRAVLSVDGNEVLFTASEDEPTQVSVWLYTGGGPGSAVPAAPGPGAGVLTQLSPGPGVHSGRRAGGTTVLTSQSLGEPGVSAAVLRDGREPLAISSLAERPGLPTPRPALLSAGPRGIRTAVLLPSWHEPGSGKLPVLLDPYGGPHAQRVLAAQGAFLTSQWFAEQGFAVVVADGRGTPGRGPAWDRAVRGDLAGPVLEDQVAALCGAGAEYGDLDLGRVAIRGWSFGGYLAALAVLRRPDVFHAAVAGAPVTDYRLYDTHYTERYLGLPDEDPGAYDGCSPEVDARRLAGAAGVVPRPLMLIHGFADDNVVVAHTLRLSSALLAARYPHTVLPLTGVTHLASQEDVTENMLLLQVEFLRSALGVGPGGAV